MQIPKVLSATGQQLIMLGRRIVRIGDVPVCGDLEVIICITIFLYHATKIRHSGFSHKSCPGC